MQTEILKVTGMTCDGCTSKIAHALKALPGVHDVVVSLSTSEAAVRYDEHQTALGQLKSAVNGAGYGIDGVGVAPAHQSKGGCCG